jgi:nucleosome assembly protein 1-like 1
MPEDLTPAVAKRVEALHKLQDERDELRKQWVEERKALELKYAGLYEVVYAKRKAVVAGEVEAEGAAGAVGADVKGIPGFWLRAMQNNGLLRDFIEEHDEEALAALRDVSVTFLDGMEGFRLDFAFGPNAFFSNAVLSKTIKLPNLFSGDDEIGDIKGSEIEWLPGKNLTVKTVKKKVKKGKGRDKTVTKEEEVPSFFR